MQLTLAAAPVLVEPSGVVTYTVVISNTLADRTLTELVVSDTLPLELTYWPVEGNSATLRPNAGWNGPSVNWLRARR
ncbi:MAG: DUF11 domain-containing protein [Anaerolineae bacterium]|uniref:hypothetical protein n=1 Tax=Candidatus Amarolinea dominans TaxID=3140696 RepID=UPI003134BEE5|nr:DUF11 domain-containing protein [Anaerolineae bacterium]